MKSILVGIPHSREYEGFEDSVSSMLTPLKSKYHIETVKVYGAKRDEAREYIANRFVKGGEDYLLFLDDDHLGHTPEMLESLISADKHVCAIKCYARYFPYQCTIMVRDHDNAIYFQVDATKGVHPCHFVGFGMTLIKQDLFSLISPPYFKCDEKGEREDNYFCEKLLAKNICVWGCFDHTLPHCGIDETNIMQKRKEGTVKFVGIANRKKALNRFMQVRRQSGGLTLKEEQMLNKIEQALNQGE